jgi:hypothetical protein
MIQCGRGGIRTHGSQTDKAEFESDALMSCDRAKEILLTILQRLAFVDCEFGRMKLRALNVEGGDTRSGDSTLLLAPVWRETPARHSKRVPSFVSRPNIALLRNENTPGSSALR